MTDLDRSDSIPALGSFSMSALRARVDALPEPSAASSARTVDRQRDFAGILSRRFDRPGQVADPESEALDAARQLVSITLVQPLLAQLRATSDAAPPFAPTPAERQFRAMSDAHLAQEIVKAARFPLVDRLARDMLSRSAAGRAAATDREVRH
ncbi:MAG: hypothetical protein KF699_00760 [Phycisphaeraceae bacterium]|nr:hypothetical protein [Phycisphaeraceae bacterium]MBX3406115.1 hypothetical protein [Phycisphaeraceae bacterium]